jgi:catechol 2,3-dioxygenase-like lactoylglutathione lyase family enzyme
MLKYLTLGAHDLKAALAFYDKLMLAIGCKRLETPEYGGGYGPEGGEAQLWVMKTNNGLPATYGNGTMIALDAPSRKAVDAFHAAALAAGGYDEGKPGIRGGADSNFYACYVRDLTGNKLSAVYDKPV